MNKSVVRRLTLHAMLLQAVFWFGICAYFAFMVTTLIDHGWSQSAAAGLMTAMSVIVILIQPVYGFLSDRYFSEKKLSVAMLALGVVFFSLMPFSLNSGNRTLVVVNMIAITVTGAQVGSLMDAWIVGLKQEYQSINYGMIRGIGSFAYALSAQIMGAITVDFGHSARIWIASAAFLAAVFIALAFRPARHERDNQTKGKNSGQLSGMEALKIVFSSKPYCLLLGVSFLLLLNNITMTTVIQILVRDFGGTAAQMGTTTAIMAVSEVPCMFLMAFVMKKIGHKKLLIFCSVVYTIRMFVTAAVGSINALIYVQILQGVTYAVLLPVSISYLSQIIDRRVRSTAVTTYGALTSSLTAVLGNLITSSFLAAGRGAQGALVFFGFSALLGFFLALYGTIRGIW